MSTISKLKNIEMGYVMVVDDDVDERMVTMLCLQHEGIQCVGCSNGLEAIKFLVDACHENKLPRLMFLDINMPVMTGWELMSVIRAMRDSIRAIPIVLTTGEHIPDNELYKVLRKPFSIDQLVAEAQRVKGLVNGG